MLIIGSHANVGQKVFLHIEMAKTAANNFDYKVRVSGLGTVYF